MVDGVSLRADWLPGKGEGDDLVVLGKVVHVAPNVGDEGHFRFRGQTKRINYLRRNCLSKILIQVCFNLLEAVLC